jgi:Aromatic-ring hydroxylase, C-terminal
MTDAFNKLVLGTSAVRRAFRRVAITAILANPPGRRTIGGLLSGIGIHYPRPRGGHRLVGRRMPDVDCGGRRLFELLRTGRFVLLAESVLDADLPVIVCAVHSDPNLPTAVLVRPDGYVAWASEAMPDEASLRTAVERWTLIADPASRV